MRAALGAIALLLATPPAAAGEKSKADCTIQVKKGDLAAEGRDLAVEAGSRVSHAVAVRGNVVLRKGADVDEAAALGGSGSHAAAMAGARVAKAATKPRSHTPWARRRGSATRCPSRWRSA